MASLTLAGIAYLLAIREFFATPRFPGASSSLGSSWLLCGTLNFFGCPRAPMMIFIAMFGMAACSGSATTPILSFPAILPLGAATPETRNLNNPDLPSPYPAGAQLFFRAVTAIHESTFALKVAFVICEFAIVFVLLDVLRRTAGSAPGSGVRLEPIVGH